MNVTANNATVEAEFKNSHLNLMILSELRQGYRVFTSDGSIRVRSQSVMDPVLRYYSKETRTHNVATIQAKLSVAYALIDTLMATVYSYVTICKAQKSSSSSSTTASDTVAVASGAVTDDGSSTITPPSPMLHVYPKRFQQVYQQHATSIAAGSLSSGAAASLPSSPPKECAHSLALGAAGRTPPQQLLQHYSSCTMMSSPSCYHDRMNIVLPVKYLRQMKDALFKCAGGDNADCGMECLLATYSEDIAVCQQIRQIIMIMREKLVEMSRILAIVDANADLFDVI